VKFNAFVFGLLNVRSLDAWFGYLRTRESVLKKHYTPNSLLVMAHTSQPARSLLDSLVALLQPLALFPFQLDLLFEYRQLHESLKRMDSYQQPISPTHKCKTSSEEEFSAATAIYTSNPSLPDLLNASAYSSPAKRCAKPRPHSYIDSGKPKLDEDINNAMKKRWSGIHLSSKLFQAYNRLDAELEYADSLEQPVIEVADGPESLDSNLSDDKPLNGRKFKKLQRKWEMLSTKESPPESPTHVKSKIPRPVTSPVRPSGIPVPCKSTKKVITPPGQAPGKKLSTPVKCNSNKKVVNNRTSRLDQLENQTPQQRHHVTRPSSLPYKPSSTVKNSKLTSPRRAVSTSVNRKPLDGHNYYTPKVVRTLSHRLPSESGHLSYNEGERLKVVLEVDEKWLLCCRGTQKGLVPWSAVIPDTKF